MTRRICTPCIALSIAALPLIGFASNSQVQPKQRGSVIPAQTGIQNLSPSMEMPKRSGGKATVLNTHDRMCP